MSSFYTPLLTAAVGVQNGDPYFADAEGRRTLTATYQAGGIVGDTVLIEGRLDASYPYVELASITADGVGEVAVMPDMRASITVAGTGSVSVGLAD